MSGDDGGTSERVAAASLAAKLSGESDGTAASTSGELLVVGEDEEEEI